jgi:signal peptidase I
MSSDKVEQTRPKKGNQKSRDRATEVANTFEWLITAFILAFVFRAFVMEAFRIPTGSMADTLMGAHFRLCCRQCGYKYDHGYASQNDRIPPGRVPLPPTRCPSCGYYDNSRRPDTVANGDRILVLKCIYQFIEPKRWDVIVFKNPTDPTINYIKRLIGLPGEKVQIIDGDIYINDQICRKPPKVQNELWMTVYNNDYQPVSPYTPMFNYHPWEQPFDTAPLSKWELGPASPIQFHLDSPTDQINTMTYRTSIGNNFRAAYAYDNVSEYDTLPFCSDLKTRFYVNPESAQGTIGIALSKYQTEYKARLDLSGEMIITKSENGSNTVELARKQIEPGKIRESFQLQFANVDHLLLFQCGGETLSYELGNGPDGAGRIRENIEPGVQIFGAGKMTLSHVAISRDIHYLEVMAVNGYKEGRATRNSPFELHEDQFFVLGDNSPNSEDGRWWDDEGIANKGLPPYRMGVVPRDYLVGKAMFVYWPSGFRPVEKFPFGMIPNIGKLRFIYGGSDKKL